MSKVGTTILIVGFLVRGTAQKSLALEIPEPGFEVYLLDQADILSASGEAQFVEKSKELAAQNGTQIALLTLPSLEGESLEEFAIATARKWALGDKDKDNGVLIALVMDTHDIRIDVGYGLEGVLPDGLTGELQRKYLVPKMREGDYEGAVLDLQAAMIKVIQQDPEFLDELAKEKTRADYGETVDLIICLLFFGGLAFLFVADKHLYWKKCPQCGRRQLRKKTEMVGLTKRRTVTSCKNCSYEKKGPITLIPVSTGGSSSSGGSFGGGSSGGSSGGGGSFGGGGSSGKW